MAKSKFEASQLVWFIGKVVGAKLEKDKETKETKKKFDEYSLTVKLPEGNTIFIRKRRWKTDKDEVQFVKDSFDKLDAIIEDINNNKPVFISKSISKPKDKPQFDWLKSFENADGRVSFSIDGFVNIQDFDIDGDNFIIKFKEKSAKFTEIESKFDFYMYAVEVNENKVTLSDGKSEFPNDIILTLPEGVENKFDIGQAYNIKAKAIKGKKVNTDGVFDFDGTSKDDYESDKLEIVSLKKLDKIVLSTVGDNTKVDTDDMPF